MHCSTALDWTSIVLAVVLLILGAVVQSAWTAWRSKIAELHIDSSTDAETARRERKRTLSRQCPARLRQGRLEPSSVLADEMWTSYALSAVRTDESWSSYACHYPKHWDKTKRPTKTTTTVCDCENQKTWTPYAANQHQLQPIHPPSPSLRCKSSAASFERTLSSEHVGVTEATSNLVRFSRKPVKLWHQDVTPTDDVGRAGLQRRSSSTSPNSHFCSSSHSLDRERPRRKEAKPAAKSSGNPLNESCCTCNESRCMLTALFLTSPLLPPPYAHRSTTPLSHVT